MDTGERLAAYLAGDLDADEARRLEGELARDPSLRARLTRLRRLEEALGELPAVDVPAAFPARLHDAVQQELDDRPVRRDELAARRSRRAGGGLPGWMPALAGAAAALVAVVAVGTVLSGGLGGEDAGPADEEAAGTAETTTMDARGTEPPIAGAAEMAPPDGPAVADVGAAYDADDVEALADLHPVRRVVDRGLADEAATDTARRYTAALSGRAGRQTAGDGAEPDAGTEAAEEEAAGDDTAAAPVETTGDVSEADLEAIRACLPEVQSDDDPSIPAYAELASFDGQDAIVLGLVAHDPDTGAFTRVQVWVVARDGCEVLYFAQVD